MTYSVEIERDVLRVLIKLDKPVRRRIQVAIDRLQHDPRPHGAIALRGMPGAYRIRVGDYRVIYTVDDGRLVVVVVDLGHRREIYRTCDLARSTHEGPARRAGPSCVSGPARPGRPGPARPAAPSGAPT